MCRRRRNRCGNGASTCGYGRPGPGPINLATQLGALVLTPQQKNENKAQARFIGSPPPPDDALASQLDQPWRQPSSRARPNPNMVDRPPSYHSYLPRANELPANHEKGSPKIKDSNACSVDTVGQHDMPYTAPRGGMQMHNQEEVSRMDARSTTTSSLSSDSDDESISTPATSISGRGVQGHCEHCGHQAQQLHTASNVNGYGGPSTIANFPWREVKDGKYARKAEKRQRKYAARAGNVNANDAQDAMYALVDAKYARKALRWHRKRCVRAGCWCAGF